MGASIAVLFYGLHYLREEAKYHVRKGQEREERDVEAASFLFSRQFSSDSTLIYPLPRQKSLKEPLSPLLSGHFGDYLLLLEHSP